MIYHKTPACFRCIFLPVKLILRLIRIIIHMLELDSWIITGEEVRSKQKLAIIYAGSEKNKNHLISLAFGHSYKEEYIGKAWFWKLPKMTRDTNFTPSLMVVEGSNFLRILFRKNNYFYIPCWVSGEVDISVDTSLLIKNKSLKSDLRRIRKNKLNFEITNELGKFRNFYHNMYVPHITQMHGRKAIIMNYDFMKKEFRNCELLLIKKEKEYIAGILLAYSKNGVCLWSIGVKNDNLDYVKAGAIGALFYFSVLHLKEKGFKKVNFGLSRPFLKDGVLQYKKKWEMRVVESNIPPKAGFIIKPLTKAAVIRAFFLNNPFICMDKGRFNGVIFAESDQSFLKQDFEKIYKDYYLRGLSKLIIYQFGEYRSREKGIVPAEFADRVTIRSAGNLF